MPTYNALVFGGAKLVDTNTFEAENHFEAISACASLHPNERVELWADGAHIATFGAAHSRRALFDRRHF